MGFAPGEQPDGTFVVPATQPGAGAVTPAPVATAVKQPLYSNGNGSKPNGYANGNSHAPDPIPNTRIAWAQFLLTQTEDLIDVFAVASQYAIEGPESALGAGGRAFKSPRPDQRKQLIYLQCRVSARLAHL